MQSTNVASSDFAGLVNPYTGEPMRVRTVAGRGPEPLYCAPDTFSTNDLQRSVNRLYELWSRVNGRQGRRSGLPKCAYTGRPLTVVKLDGGYHFDGGFDPKRPAPREEFLRFATMRGGKPAEPPKSGRDQ